MSGSNDSSLRSRQKLILIVLSVALATSGLVVLLFLKRLPLPARLGLGISDFIAASALMLFVRQNYPGRNS